MSLNIDYCPRCGKIFAKGYREMCPNCIKEVEEEYERCIKYLRENKGANITELSEATEVSVKQITKFIREGRISLHNAPNLTYPCEVCGILIREGMMCDQCRKKFQKDVQAAQEMEQKKRLEEQRRHDGLIYKSRDFRNL